jgi:hypothetical protein
MFQISQKIVLFALFTLIFIFSTVNINAQKRDHFTEKEADMIRETQEIDFRMKVFVKAIDRRFLVLNKIDTAEDKQVKKDLETWGELPKGTNALLLKDIERILNEAINNIDDVATRDFKTKLLPKAMKILVESCKKFLPQLSSLDEKSTDKAEKDAIINSNEYCGQIIDAQTKIPEEEKPIKKGKN